MPALHISTHNVLNLAYAIFRFFGGNFFDFRNLVKTALSLVRYFKIIFFHVPGLLEKLSQHEIIDVRLGCVSYFQNT